MNLFAPRAVRDLVDGPVHHLEIRNMLELGSRAMQMEPPSLARRAPSAATSCSNSASSDTCQKPTDDSVTLPVALGVVIPMTVALVLFVFFHRKYKKKLRAEDAADEEKYRSMDFGMDLSFGPNKKKKKLPNGLETSSVKHTRGLSLEDTESPYFFPTGGRNSVESLASLGRSIRGDPYHTGKADDMSIRSPSPFTRRDTNSTAAPSMFDTNAGLLGHAQGNPRSMPPRGTSLPPPPHLHPHVQEPEKAMLAASSPAAGQTNGGLAPAAADQSRDSYMAAAGFRKSNNYLGQFIHSRDPSVDPSAESKEMKTGDESPKVDSATSTLLGSDSTGKHSDSEYFKEIETGAPGVALSPPATTRSAPSDKPEQHEVHDKYQSVQGSMHEATPGAHDRNTHTQSYLSEYSNQGIGETEFKVTPASPPRHSQNTTASDPRHSDYRNSTYSQESAGAVPPRGQSLNAPLPEIHEHHEPYEDNLEVDEGLRNLDFDVNRLSVFMRPLPPDDPAENPEERANRIRSFYKEYFDEAKPGQNPAPNRFAQQPGRGDYYEDYDGEYLSNGYSIYDEQQKGFIVGGAPFAQPITRRAMTPPPRAPPRNFRARSGSNAPGPRFGGPRSGTSMSGYMTPPRAGSSMSNFRSGERGRPRQKPLPPPEPLMSLKTPALLKEDSALYAAFDLAPPPTFRQRQNGMRPDSPLGTERPYSPSVRPHTPLQSSYDELSPIPSPHLLRKSGTFTALDFAPRPRFAGIDTGSDAGSIRSGGSGMSAAQAYAIRAGAHRLSRLPKELAGTKDDIMTSLKPRWDIGR
ncbi:uncharacterized protein PV09_03816 [Verruconis gallopava]|uniref:Uncharacterized protein n=1 Tax=Verruconis gallopava TaxID=253628 RepID=A0A0D2B1T4_9PEZI|nr:uncharacterized protein PV09_03816 [Verruconis gallopava]KIW05289.1 hypothetical protein PV09_03816 [Verruconis gallopava]